MQDKYTTLNQQSNDANQEYLNVDHEISTRKDQQMEWDRILMSLTEDMHVNDENIREKQSTIDFLENELAQKQEGLNQLIQIDQEKVNADAIWMSDCLKTIQNDQRFHNKPIGPIGKKFFRFPLQIPSSPRSIYPLYQSILVICGRETSCTNHVLVCLLG